MPVTTNMTGENLDFVEVLMLAMLRTWLSGPGGETPLGEWLFYLNDALEKKRKAAEKPLPSDGVPI